MAEASNHKPPNGLNGNSTINDVARLASVSKKTVSRVINKSPLLSDKTRLHVEKVIQDIGYVPNPQARALALRRNFIIAVIHDNPNAQFLVNVQNGLLTGIAGTEFGLMVKPVDRNSPNIVTAIKEFLEQHRPYGVMLLPPISDNEELAQLCENFGTRYVRMASVELDTPEHMVTSNDRGAAQEAVEYLIEMGHKNIALIEGPKDFISTAERRAGYEQAMANAKLTIAPAMIAEGNYTYQSGLDVGLAILSRDERPTAIFVSNDEMATGVIIAARRLGIDIPNDLSIVGFDDTPMSNQVWPALTTVRWPIVDMSRAAAAKLIAGSGQAPDENTFLTSVLVKRDSVAPPRKKSA